MMISELILQLDRLEDLLGGLPVELDSGSVVTEADIVSDSGIAAVARRDKNATAALPSVISVCFADVLENGESHAAMFARKAYAVADAMELERIKKR